MTDHPLHVPGAAPGVLAACPAQAAAVPHHTPQSRQLLERAVWPHFVTHYTKSVRSLGGRGGPCSGNGSSH